MIGKESGKLDIILYLITVILVVRESDPLPFSKRGESEQDQTRLTLRL